MKKIFLIVAVVCIILSTVLTGCLQENKSGNNNAEVEIKKTDTPFLWKINSSETSYLFGTVHLRDDRIFLNLNESIEESLDNVDMVYTETKFDDETKIKMALSSRLDEGTVDDLIPETVSQKLEEYLENQGLSENQIEDFKKYKIWVIATSLSTVKDQLNNLGEPILDEYIWQTAKEKGKKTHGLETAEEQLNIFDSLSIENQTYLLNETLNSLIDYEKSDKNPIDITLEAYIEGDAEKIYNLSLSDFNESNPLDVKLKNKIFIERNQRMASRIAEVVLNNPDKSYFFAVGASHFYGENSLIEFLNEEFQ